MPALRDEIKAKLTPLLEGLLDTDVAVNLVSGEGAQHMALLAAILQLGLGIRLVTVPATAGPEQKGFLEL
jgi:hypothetical protein